MTYRALERAVRFSAVGAVLKLPHRTSLLEVRVRCGTAGQAFPGAVRYPRHG